MSDKTAFVEDYIADVRSLLDSIDSGAVNKAIQWFWKARAEDRIIYTCGNGGSASISSHIVAEIIKGASFGRRKRFRIIGLTDSIATITAYANDVDYEHVFVEPLKNFAQPGDVLIASSGSGNSANVLKAVEYANEAGVKTIGLTSSSSGKLRDLVQLPLVVPSRHIGRLEDCFFIMTHILCYAFMEDRDL